MLIYLEEIKKKNLIMWLSVFVFIILLTTALIFLQIIVTKEVDNGELREKI